MSADANGGKQRCKIRQQAGKKAMSHSPDAYGPIVDSQDVDGSVCASLNGGGQQSEEGVWAVYAQQLIGDSERSTAGEGPQ